MDSGDEVVNVETSGRRTRSGRCSKPVQSRPAIRKTRKKMVLVEVEVSDEDENESSQQAAIKDTSEIITKEDDVSSECRTDSDEKQIKKKYDQEKFDSDKKIEETDDLDDDDIPLKSLVDDDKTTFKSLVDDSFDKTTLKTLVNDSFEIIENDITIESVKTKSICEEIIEEFEPITEPQSELKTTSSVIETSSDDNAIATDLQHEKQEQDTSDDNSIDANGLIEDIDNICNSVADEVTNASIKDEEFSEPMEVDEDNLLSESVKVDLIVSESDTMTTEKLTTEDFIDSEPATITTEKLTTEDLIDSEPATITTEKLTTEGLTDSKPATITTEKFEQPEELPANKMGDTEDMDVQTFAREPVELESVSEIKPEEPMEDEDIPNDKQEVIENKQVLPADPDAENISEDELPVVQVAKVPETEEVSDEELPGPKRAELPADTEVVSEDELPAVKKEGTKRKIAEGDYDPGSPTSENEVSPKKPFLELEAEKEKEKPEKPKKLPELDKYWKAVNDDPTDFTGWTYLLQYVDQENDMEAAREAYDAFLSHYPYCYGYWRKYADYEKRKGNKKKCEEVFERGLKAIPLSVDLWIHYLTYVRTTKPEDEDFVRSQFERALNACGLEFRSDRLWDSYIKWETDAKRLQHATAIYDRLLTTPTQGYTTHFDNFQEHVTSNPPNKILEVDEFLALRKEVKHMLKHDVTTEPGDNPDVPPGEDTEEISTDEETKAIRERILSIRRKIHKNTTTAVTSRWNFEEGIKRPYFHVKPLERCQLKNWQEYLDYEIGQADKTRIIVLFERCLIACALYEEFWLRFVHYLESLKDQELHQKIKDVYERACTIHHIKKPNLHLQWAMFEESIKNYTKAAEILINLEKSVPNILQVAYRRINLERRREDHEKCAQLYELYIANAKNKTISTNLSIKYSRFCHKVMKNVEKAVEILTSALAKDANNPRLYLQLIDLSMQKDDINGDVIEEVIGYLDAFLEKENIDIDQKVLFAQRKLEFLEDFGSDIYTVQKAYEEYQKHIKTSKDTKKKEPTKGDTPTGKKEKNPPLPASQANSYANYGNYGNSSGTAGAYQYSGSQQGQYNYSQYGQNEQYQYGNWQYPQSGYSGYNQWSGYGGGYGY